MVTRSWPMRPAILVPLKTRAGVAQAPIEPGERCLRCDAVAGAEAVEVVALHDTGEALALAGADDVDLGAGLEQLGGELLAERVLGRVRRAHLDDVAARRHARPCAKCPASGLLTLRGSIAPKASWTAE